MARLAGILALIVSCAYHNGQAMSCPNKSLKKTAKNLKKELFHAVVQGDLETVATCYRASTVINYCRCQMAPRPRFWEHLRDFAHGRYYWGDPHDTLLHIAVRLKAHDIVKYLLEHGAVPNACNSRKETPLHYAAQENDNQIVELLLRYGGSVGFVDWEGRTALHKMFAGQSASSLECVETLCCHGIERDVLDINQYKALSLYVYFGGPVTIEFFLEYFDEFVDSFYTDPNQDEILVPGIDLKIAPSKLLTFLYHTDHIKARSVLDRLTLDCASLMLKESNFLDYTAVKKKRWRYKGLDLSATEFATKKQLCSMLAQKQLMTNHKVNFIFG